MKAKIIKIGNSQGIRIPKPLIYQAGLKGEVEIKVEENRLVIYAAEQPRARWPEAFRTMASKSDDILIDEDSAPSRWDEEEWEWK